MLTRRHLLATGLALTAVFPIPVAAAIQAYTPGLAVPRRSTLIAQNGDKELSRIIAGPYCISGLERARPDQRFALPASRPSK